jgi:hypothetical protein
MIILFHKTYDGESIYDVDRDTSEALIASYNPLLQNIPVDEHGFQKGKFTVTIKWESE